MATHIKYIIVPDVHGRDFHVETMNSFIEHSSAHMVFLGDYLDPYPQEGISVETAIDRFKEIIDMKRNYPNRITLLIGNHDLHYFDGSIDGCRMSIEHHKEINALFMDNWDEDPNFFNFTKFVNVGKKNFIFSHAGFGFQWFKHHALELGVVKDDEERFGVSFSKKFSYETLHSIDWDLLAREPKWIKYYAEAGQSRGGWSNHPSFLWADVTDHLFSDVMLDGAVQVFGHTRQQTGFNIRYKNYYCLDSRTLSYINNNGTVLNCEMKPIKDNGEKYKNEYLEYLKKASMFFL